MQFSAGPKPYTITKRGRSLGKASSSYGLVAFLFIIGCLMSFWWDPNHTQQQMRHCHIYIYIYMAVSHLFPSKDFSKGLLLQICVFTIIYMVFAILKQLWLGTVTNEKLPYIYIHIHIHIHVCSNLCY